jgi:HEAT repeat protein
MKRGVWLIAVLSLLLAAWTVPAWSQEAPCAEDDDACWLRQLAGEGPPAMWAANKLGARQVVAAVPLLLKKLESKDQYMATAAVQALVRIGAPAVLDLVKATSHKSAEVRKYAAYALGKIGGQDAFAAVQKAARDPDKNVRKQAATALGLMRDTRGMTTLLDLLRDASVGVRAEAATSLGALGNPHAALPLIEQGLCDPSPEVARAATGALVALGEPVVDPLIEHFNTTPAYARERILLTLGNLATTHGGKTKERAVKTCLWVLPRKNEAPAVRAVAAYFIGHFEAREATDALNQTLQEASGSQNEGMQKLAAACRIALDKVNPKPAPPK